MLLREVEYARPATVEEAVRPPLRARWGTCPRRGPDARQRHEGPGSLARCSRRSRRSRRASRDLVLRRSELARARRDGDEHPGDRVRRGRGGPADPGRGRRDDRRRADPKPRHDRRQRLRQRPDEPLPAAARGARGDVHDPQHERRADGLRGRVLPRRLHDGRRRGRAADADLRPDPQAGHGRRDGRRHARRARNVPRRAQRRPSAPTARGSRSAACRRSRCARPRWRSGSPAETTPRPPSGPQRRASARRSIRRPTSTRARDYRRHLAEVSAVRAVLQAAERAKG